LDYKLTRNHIVEALVHAEACRVFMNFISVGKEAIENLISLQGLLYLLLGQSRQALDLFESIPTVETEMPPTQLLGLTVSLVATNKPHDAVIRLKRFPDLIDGMISSMNTYANDLYTHDQRELAIEILKFIVKNFSTRKEAYSSIQRLFILTRLRPDLVEIDLKVQKTFKEKLKEEGKDLTKRGVPATWKKSLPIQISASENEGLAEQFKGFYHILDLSIDHERNEIHVIAWNESNKSTWKLVFDEAYKPALEESVKIKITSGTITKIHSADKKDIIRGKLIFEDPAIQPVLVKPW
jgi:hypothetical protein